jgi:hypothetical protein
MPRGSRKEKKRTGIFFSPVREIMESWPSILT